MTTQLRTEDIIILIPNDFNIDNFLSIIKKNKELVQQILNEE